MSYSYERVDQRRRPLGPAGGRSAFGYWIPLALTVTAATVGLVAWVWSERGDDDETGPPNESQEGKIPGAPPGYPPNAQPGDPSNQAGPPSGSYTTGPPPESYQTGPPTGSYQTGPPPASYQTGPQPGPYPEGPYQAGPSGEFARNTGDNAGGYADGGVMARVSGALRRTPSPQQIFDGASKKVVAGMAVAGAAVGGALSSIREDDKEDYADHSRWSQEEGNSESIPGGKGGARSTASGSTATTARRSSSPSARYHANVKRKTVGIVVSAETSYIGSQDDDEHSSILSHLPAHFDPATARVYVLIYSPDLKQHPLSEGGRNAGSVTSSFSNIGTEEIRTPGEELEKPLSVMDPNPSNSPSSGGNTPNTPALSATASPAFSSLYSQAQQLVEKDTMILPFTTPTGYIHLLRHLSPDVVYVPESLSGADGDAITHMTSWVGQIVVVVGAEGGHGGLVDTEDEDGHNDGDTERWWSSSDRVGLGKGVEVVEGIRIGEDWTRRVQGQE